MAITSVTPFFWPFRPNSVGSTVAPVTTSITLNAINDKMAMIVQVPKSGTLDKFEWRTGSVSNNPDNGVRCSFQDLDFSTGFPDGTQDQYRDITGTLSANTWQVPGLMTSDGTDVGSKRTVTRGNWIACVVEFVSFVASDNFQVSTYRNDLDFVNHYIGNASTGTYAKDTASGQPIIALKYDDGTYAQFPDAVFPISNITTNTYNSGSTPDEYAMKFSLAAPVRVAGLWATVDLDGDADLVLYNSGGTALGTCSFDKDQRSGSVGAPIWGYFTSSVSLSASTTYYIAVKPTSVTSVSMYTLDANSSGLMVAMPNGGNSYLSTRTDAGSWSDTTTSYPVMGLVIDGIDDGAGGGGGGGGSYTFVG